MILPNELLHRLEVLESPVILLEGTRALPPGVDAVLTRFSAKLAEMIPYGKCRSGNVPGSDDAFSRGVESIAPERLEQFLPTTKRRPATLHPAASVLVLDALTLKVAEEIAKETVACSPKNASMIKNRLVTKRKTKSNYLMRNTLKVTGDGKMFAPANVGIFFRKSRQSGWRWHRTYDCCMPQTGNRFDLQSPRIATLVNGRYSFCSV
jgi:hypothetical protein